MSTGGRIWRQDLAAGLGGRTWGQDLAAGLGKGIWQGELGLRFGTRAAAMMGMGENAWSTTTFQKKSKFR